MVKTPVNEMDVRSGRQVDHQRDISTQSLDGETGCRPTPSGFAASNAAAGTVAAAWTVVTMEGEAPRIFFGEPITNNNCRSTTIRKELLFSLVLSSRSSSVWSSVPSPMSSLALQSDQLSTPTSASSPISSLAQPLISSSILPPVLLSTSPSV